MWVHKMNVCVSELYHEHIKIFLLRKIDSNEQKNEPFDTKKLRC